MKNVKYHTHIIGNLPEYTFAKTYRNWARIGKVIREVIWCSCLPHMVSTHINKRQHLPDVGRVMQTTLRLWLQHSDVTCTSRDALPPSPSSLSSSSSAAAAATETREGHALSAPPTSRPSRPCALFPHENILASVHNYCKKKLSSLQRLFKDDIRHLAGLKQQISQKMILLVQHIALMSLCCVITRWHGSARVF